MEAVKESNIRKTECETKESRLYSLCQWFSTRAIVPPRRYLAMCGDIFGCHKWTAATSIYWVEARDAAKHPTMRRQLPIKKSIIWSKMRWCCILCSQGWSSF